MVKCVAQLNQNGGIGLFLYFMGLIVTGPLLLSLFFLLNKNSLFHRAAVYLLAVILFMGSGWALLQGKITYQPVSDILGNLFIFGNAAAIIGEVYWTWRWKDWVQGGLAVVQGSLLGWFVWQAGWAGGLGSFVLDHLAGMTFLLVDGVGAIILIFALRYMDAHERSRSLKKNRQPLFFAAAALLLGAMNGLILSNHLLWLLFFWQLIVAGTFLLIAHERTQLSLKTARIFFGMCSIGGIAFLAGLVQVFSKAGTLLLSDLLIFKESTLLVAPFSCFVVACLVFSAQFPFQNTLLRSTTTATPVLAMLQSSATVTAGAYFILRLSPVFINTWLAHIVAVLGTFTFAAAALLAAMQHESRRILTLTTISNLGLVFSLACFPALPALYAAILLLVLHGVSKVLLLLCGGNHSPSHIPQLLALFGGMSMLMPPFGIPMAQWTAMESSVRNPVALGLILAGSVFSMIVWARFVGERLPVIFEAGNGEKNELLLCAPQLVLAFVILVLSVFLIPFSNFSVAPIFKENYGRFGDIAQGSTGAFLIRGFSGVDPMWLFAALGLIFVIGWVGTRSFVGRAGENELPVFLIAEGVTENATVEGDETLLENQDEDEEMTDHAPPSIGIAQDTEKHCAAEEAAESICEAEPISEEVELDENSPTIILPDSTTEEEGTSQVAGTFQIPITEVPLSIPRCVVFSAFPDAKKTNLYATVIAVALIILMLEVVYR